MKKKFKRYGVLIVFMAMTLLGLIVAYGVGEKSSLWKLWSIVDVAFSVALGVMAFLAYREFIKSEDEIKIYFKVDGNEIETGLSLLRKDCSRGEILGILGMMQKESAKRFSIETSRVPVLLKEIQEIQKGNEEKIVVDMTQETQEEFEQYDLESLKIKPKELSDDN